jgi:hypothetical protein
LPYVEPQLGAVAQELSLFTIALDVLSGDDPRLSLQKDEAGVKE